MTSVSNYVKNIENNITVTFKLSVSVNSANEKVSKYCSIKSGVLQDKSVFYAADIVPQMTPQKKQSPTIQ